jgi:MFS family permease
MLFIRVSEHHEPQDEGDSGNLAKFAVQGFKILFETPSVLIVMITFLSLAVIYLPTEMVVLPSYYNGKGDPEGLGLLISVMAAASTLGSLLFERLVKFLSFSKLLRIAVLGVGITMVPMSMLPAQWVMLGCGAVLGFVWGPLGPLLNTVIQRKVPANKRGRVFSLEMVIWSGGPMMSMALVGWAVDAFGVHSIYPVIAGLVLLSGILVASSRHLVELNVADYMDAAEPA